MLFQLICEIGAIAQRLSSNGYCDCQRALLLTFGMRLKNNVVFFKDKNNWFIFLCCLATLLGKQSQMSNAHRAKYLKILKRYSVNSELLYFVRHSTGVVDSYVRACPDFFSGPPVPFRELRSLDQAGRTVAGCFWEGNRCR